MRRVDIASKPCWVILVTGNNLTINDAQPLIQSGSNLPSALFNSEPVWLVLALPQTLSQTILRTGITWQVQLICPTAALATYTQRKFAPFL